MDCAVVFVCVVAAPVAEESLELLTSYIQSLICFGLYVSVPRLQQVCALVFQAYSRTHLAPLALFH